MTASIIGLLAVLIPFAIWLYKRKAAKSDDPHEQNTVRREAIAKQLFTRDGPSINGSLADDLERLRSLSRDKQRPPSDTANDRTAIHSKL